MQQLAEVIRLGNWLAVAVRRPDLCDDCRGFLSQTHCSSVEQDIRSGRSLGLALFDSSGSVAGSELESSIIISPVRSSGCLNLAI
jgi:hypothetical protein